MRRFFHPLTVIILFSVVFSFSGVAFAAPRTVSRDGAWQHVEQIAPTRPESDVWIRPQKFRAFQLNRAALRAALARARKESPYERLVADAEIELPMPDGTFARFRIIESPVMAPELAAKFPEIKTSRGVGMDDPQANVRLDITPQGFHAQILSPLGVSRRPDRHIWTIEQADEMHFGDESELSRPHGARRIASVFGVAVHRRGQRHHGKNHRPARIFGLIPRKNVPPKNPSSKIFKAAWTFRASTANSFGPIAAFASISSTVRIQILRQLAVLTRPLSLRMTVFCGRRRTLT
jgi:hypothetical protein